MERNKGARGERELFGLLADRLGRIVKRRTDSSREGGCDTLDIPGWSVEVKRTERFESAFWSQAIRQAEKDLNRPVLFWRKSRMRWVAFIDPHDLRPDIWPNAGVADPIQMDWEAWTQLARELL